MRTKWRDLSGLVLHNANMIGVRMTGCDLRGTDWTGSKFNNASITACDMRDSVAQYCDFSSAVLSQCQIDGADFLYSEFGKPKHRCKMDDVKGHAVISSEELINGKFNDGTKDVRIKQPSEKERARIPARPRALLVLGEPGFQSRRYEESPTIKPSSVRRRVRRSSLDLYPEAMD